MRGIFSIIRAWRTCTKWATAIFVLAAAVSVSADSLPTSSPNAVAETSSAFSKTSATDFNSPNAVAKKSATPSTKPGFLYSRYLQNENLYTDTASAGSFVLSRRDDFFSNSQTRLDGLLQQQISTAPSVLKRQLLDAFLNPAANNVSAEWKNTLLANGWQAGEILLQEAIESATYDARRSGFIRNIGIDIRTELGRRFQHAGIDILGAFHASERDAFVWQLRGYSGRDSDDDDVSGGNVGLIYRRASGDSMLGANVFVDLQQQEIFKDGKPGKPENADFWRWGGGGEFRSAWLDVFGNYYDAVTKPYVQTVTVNNALVRRHIYSAGGYDAEVNLHAPDYPWFVLAASYFSWRGDLGAADDTGARYGFKLAPRSFPAILELEYQGSGDADKRFGGSFALNYELGRDYGNLGELASNGEFRPQDYFFLPVQREYTQQIRTIDSATFDRAFWVIGQRDIVRGEVRIIRDPKRGGKSLITLRANAASTVSVTFPVIQNEVFTIVATGRATLHYNLRYGINGDALQLVGLGTAAVSGSIEVEYVDSDAGSAASILQHLRFLGAGEMLLIANRDTGFVAVTPDLTLRIASAGTTVSIRYAPPLVRGERGITYITMYSGGVTVQTPSGGISHLCQGAQGINEVSRDGITLEVACQFDTTNHVKLAETAAYNQAPIMTIAGRRELLVSMTPPQQRGGTPTLSFILGQAAATTHMATAMLAEITYAGSGYQYRETGGTRGLRIDQSGQVFVQATAVATGSAKVYLQTLALYFEVYNPARPEVAPRSGSWQVVVQGNVFEDDTTIESQQLSGAPASLFTLIMPLLAGGNGEVQQTAAAAALQINGGTGDYVLQSFAGNNSAHFPTRNLGEGRGEVDVQRQIDGTILPSDSRYAITAVADDRGYLSHLTEPSTVVLQLRYLEVLNNARLELIDSAGQAIYQGTTPVVVYDGLGNTVQINVPGYNVAQLGESQYRLEYLIYDSVDGLEVVSNLAGDIPVGYFQYEGGSSLAVVAPTIEGGPYNMALQQDDNNPRRWGLHFDIQDPNARPLTSTVAIKVSLRVAVTDTPLAMQITLLAGLEVAGRYMEVEERRLPPLRVSVVGAPISGSGTAATDTYKHNYASGEQITRVQDGAKQITLRTLSDVQPIIATLSASGGGNIYYYQLVTNSGASGNPYAALSGANGNVLYYHSEPPSGVLRFEIEVRDNTVLEVGVRNLYQPSIITVTFYVQNRTPQRALPFSLTIAISSDAIRQSILLECLGAIDILVERECAPLMTIGAAQFAATLTDGTVLGVYDNAQTIRLTLAKLVGLGGGNDVTFDVGGGNNFVAVYANASGRDTAPNARDFNLLAIPRDFAEGAAAATVQIIDIIGKNWQGGRTGDGTEIIGATTTITAAARRVQLLSRNIQASVSTNLQWRGPVATYLQNGKRVILATLENDERLGAERLLAAKIIPRGGIGNSPFGFYQYSLINASDNLAFSVGIDSGDVTYGARSNVSIYTLSVAAWDADTGEGRLSRLSRAITTTFRVSLVSLSVLFDADVSSLTFWRADDAANATLSVLPATTLTINNFYENSHNPSVCEITLGCEWTFLGNIQAHNSNGAVLPELLTWQAAAGLLLRPTTIMQNSAPVAVQEVWLNAQTRFNTFGILQGDDNFNINVAYIDGGTSVQFLVRGTDSGRVQRIRLPQQAVQFEPSILFMSGLAYENSAATKLSVGTILWPDLSSLAVVVNTLLIPQTQQSKISCIAPAAAAEFCTALTLENDVLYLQKDGYAPSLPAQALTIIAAVEIVRNGSPSRTLSAQIIIDGRGADSGDFLLSAAVGASSPGLELFTASGAAITSRAALPANDNSDNNLIALEMQAPFANASGPSAGNWINVATLSLSGGQPPYSGKLLSVNDAFAQGTVIGLSADAVQGRIVDGGSQAVLQVALPAADYALRTSSIPILLTYNFVVEDSAGRRHSLRVRATDTLRAANLAAVPLHLGDTAANLDAVYGGGGTAADPYIVPSLPGVPVLIGELQLPGPGTDYRIWAGKRGRAVGEPEGELGQLYVSRKLSLNARPALYIAMPPSDVRLRQWHEYVIQYLPSGALRRQTLYVAPVARAAAHTVNIINTSFALLGGLGSAASPFKVIANAGAITIGDVVGTGVQFTAVANYLQARNLPLQVGSLPSYIGEVQVSLMVLPSLLPGQTARLGVMGYRQRTSNGQQYATEFSHSPTTDIYVVGGGGGQIKRILFALITSTAPGMLTFNAATLATLSTNMQYVGCGDSGNNGCRAFGGDVVSVSEQGGNFQVLISDINAGAGGSFQASLFFIAPDNSQIVIDVAGIVPLQIGSGVPRVYVTGSERPIKIAQLELPTSNIYSIVPRDGLWMDSTGGLFATDFSALPLIADNGQKTFSLVVRDDLWYTPHVPLTVTTWVYREDSPTPPLAAVVDNSFSSANVNAFFAGTAGDNLTLVFSGGAAYTPQHYRYELLEGPSFITILANNDVQLTAADGLASLALSRELYESARDSRAPRAEMTLLVFDSRRGLPDASDAVGSLVIATIHIAATPLQAGPIAAPAYTRGGTSNILTLDSNNPRAVLSPNGARLLVATFDVSLNVWLDDVSAASAPFYFTVQATTNVARRYQILSRASNGGAIALPPNEAYTLSVIGIQGLQTMALSIAISITSAPFQAVFYTEQNNIISLAITTSVYQLSDVEYADVRLGVFGGRDVFSAFNSSVTEVRDAVYNGQDYSLARSNFNNLPVFLQQFIVPQTQNIDILNSGERPKFIGDWQLTETNRSPVYGQHTIGFSGIGLPSSTDRAAVSLTIDIVRGASAFAARTLILPPVNRSSIIFYFEHVEGQGIVEINYTDRDTWVPMGNLASYFYTDPAVQIISIKADTLDVESDSDFAQIGQGDGDVLYFTIDEPSGDIFLNRARNLFTTDLKYTPSRIPPGNYKSPVPLTATVYYRSSEGFSGVQTLIATLTNIVINPRSSGGDLDAGNASPPLIQGPPAGTKITLYLESVDDALVVDPTDASTWTPMGNITSYFHIDDSVQLVSVSEVDPGIFLTNSVSGTFVGALSYNIQSNGNIRLSNAVNLLNFDKLSPSTIPAGIYTDLNGGGIIVTVFYTSSKPGFSGLQSYVITLNPIVINSIPKGTVNLRGTFPLTGFSQTRHIPPIVTLEFNMGKSLPSNLDAAVPRENNRRSWIWVGNYLRGLIEAEIAPAWYRSEYLVTLTPPRITAVTELTKINKSFRLSYALDSNSDIYITQIDRIENGTFIPTDFAELDAAVILDGGTREYGRFSEGLANRAPGQPAGSTFYHFVLQVGGPAANKARPYNTYPYWNAASQQLEKAVSFRALSGISSINNLDVSDNVQHPFVSQIQQHLRIDNAAFNYYIETDPEALAYRTGITDCQLCVEINSDKNLPVPVSPENDYYKIGYKSRSFDGQFTTHYITALWVSNEVFDASNGFPEVGTLDSTINAIYDGSGRFVSYNQFLTFFNHPDPAKRLKIDITMPLEIETSVLVQGGIVVQIPPDMKAAIKLTN